MTKRADSQLTRPVVGSRPTADFRLPSCRAGRDPLSPAFRFEVLAPALDEAKTMGRQDSTVALTHHQWLRANEEAAETSRVVPIPPREARPLLGANIAVVSGLRLRGPIPLAEAPESEGLRLLSPVASAGVRRRARLLWSRAGAASDHCKGDQTIVASSVRSTR